jgi:hypothetical protein
MLPDNGASVPAVWYATAALYRRLRLLPPRDSAAAAVFCARTAAPRRLVRQKNSIFSLQ